MATPKGKKELKSETVLKDLAALRATFEKVKLDVSPGSDGFDVADQSDNVGHWMVHLQNLNGSLKVLEGQAQGWKDREQANREAKDAGEE